jgi:hypothetical protein
LSGSDVFISYSSQDRDRARKFAEALEQEGFAVWWDDALHSGETFDEVIEAELRSAAAVVVLWSPNSVSSRWVRAEATIADRRGKLIPAIIEPCERPIIFELTHTVNLSHWNGEGSDRTWQVFVSDLRRLTGKAQGMPGASPVPSVNPSNQRPTPFPVPQPNSSDDDEEYNPTQIYVRSNDVAGFESEPVHCLAWSRDGERDINFPIGMAGAKIGRAAPAEIIVADPLISRSHCKVELVGDELYVTDLNSTNGTYIDDDRIVAATPLPVGSTLKLGDSELVHQILTRAEV